MVASIEPADIGTCKSLKIRCISETSWFDTDQLLADIKAGGGNTQNQYAIEWNSKNSGGYSALVETEDLDGKWTKFLLDTGWNFAWMDYAFQREGIDKMLERGEIDFLYISHEHMDHFWGLPVVMKYNRQIKVLISKNFYAEGKELICTSGHRGELIELEAGKIQKLFTGCGSFAFDIPIMLRVHGEQGLFFNLKDKGLVTVTGCCHMGVIDLFKAGTNLIQGHPQPYGIYGGLHIAPFDKWEEKFDPIIGDLASLGLNKVAANHCTGALAIEKMIAAGIPVVRGSAKYGSRSKLYVGNGDEVMF
jgi:7,8-dihydropterin-6-yl-methyl-4-(beta-D-ribofuranosyl)aminobenzene 5'-phosphate synthase